MDVVAKILNIFPVKRQTNKDSHQDTKTTNLISEEGWTPPFFSESQCRLVLFRDHEGRGKISMFDTKQHASHNSSSQVESTSGNGTFNNDSLSSSLCSSASLSLNSKSSLSRRQSSDSELLGEMMFGSMPMKLVGNSVKIHYVKSEQQLILTKIFTAQHRSMPTCRVADFSESCPLPGHLYSAADNSLTVPSVSPDSEYKCRSSSFNLSPCPSPSSSLPISLGSSYNQESSPIQSWTQGIPVPTSSLSSSYTRRLHRARSTSLENRTQLFHRVLRPMDQSTSAVKKGKKYAVGIIFSLLEMAPNERRLFQEFFFSHFTLINSHLEQLREKIEEALSNKRHLLSESVTAAYETFVNHITSLYCTQRIKNPVWLSVVRGTQESKDLCRKFLSEFTYLATELDTKDSKFFFSTLLTCVLSLHLSWTFTVSRNGYANLRHEKLASRSLAVLPERHPYNPLWAQLGDLYGAVTDPLIVTRTIVTGGNVALIHRLLFVLTYFIRCSEIESTDLLELRKSFLEESDKGCDESRAGSTVTVTGDAIPCPRSEPPHFLRSDLPILKPHPFNLGLISGTNSLHSSSHTNSILDLPKSVCSTGFSVSSETNPEPELSSTNSKPADSGQVHVCVGSPLSFNVHSNTTDSSSNFKDQESNRIYQNTHKISTFTNLCNQCSSHNFPNADSRARSLLSHSVDQVPTPHLLNSQSSISSIHHNQFSCMSTKQNQTSIHSSVCLSNTASLPSDHNPLSLCANPRCTCSVDSSDSGVSEQVTDSGQFSDPDSNLKERDCSEVGPTNTLKDHSHFSSHTNCDNEEVDPFTHRVAQGNYLSVLSHDNFHKLFHKEDVADPHQIPGVTLTSCNKKNFTANSLHYKSSKLVPSSQNDLEETSFHSEKNPLHLSSNANMSLSPNVISSINRSSSSPNMFDSTPGLKRKFSRSLSQNRSWTGLPLLDAAYLDPHAGSLEGEPNFLVNEVPCSNPPISLKIDRVNVEESLSAHSMQLLSSSPTSSMRPESLRSQGMKYADQFQDFTAVDMSSVIASKPTTIPSKSSKVPLQKSSFCPKNGADSCLRDFGHSLMAGFSSAYLSDFVLHGTSEPLSTFKDSLISDLSSLVKNTIVDVPIQHGAAIIIDVDSLTCKVFLVSKSDRTQDGELMTGTPHSSHSVHEMVQSVALLWKMQMSSQFCLSHLEEKLMDLNGKGEMLSSAFFKHGEFADLPLLFQHLSYAMNAHHSDQLLLQAVASVHCSNMNQTISSKLQSVFLHSVLE